MQSNRMECGICIEATIDSRGRAIETKEWRKILKDFAWWGWFPWRRNPKNTKWSSPFLTQYQAAIHSRSLRAQAHHYLLSLQTLLSFPPPSCVVSSVLLAPPLFLLKWKIPRLYFVPALLYLYCVYWTTNQWPQFKITKKPARS